MKFDLDRMRAAIFARRDVIAPAYGIRCPAGNPHGFIDQVITELDQRPSEDVFVARRDARGVPGGSPFHRE